MTNHDLSEPARDEKRCSRCRAVKRRAEFRNKKSAPDGKDWWCKACQTAAKKDYMRRKPEVQYRASQKHRRAYRSRKTVHQIVERALKAGKIAKPSRCEDCGAGGRIEGHHDDYSKPLTVRWLCKPCHYVADQQREAA